MERVLAIFAHPDDEASCAGTLANHSDAGDAVRILWLSRGENATTLAMDREQRIRERARQAEKVGALLGVETRRCPACNRHLGGELHRSRCGTCRARLH